MLASPIACICNLSLSTGIFPDILKQAIIHPVFKGNGKDPRDPGWYRPITILPSLSKIIETVVCDTLSPHLPKVYKQIGRNSRDEMDEIDYSKSKSTPRKTKGDR